MTEQEKDSIRQSIWAIKANINLIRKEFDTLKEYGVEVQDMHIEGVGMDFNGVHAEMQISGGAIRDVAGAVNQITQPFGLSGSGTRYFSLSDLEVRGHA